VSSDFDQTGESATIVGAVTSRPGSGGTGNVYLDERWLSIRWDAWHKCVYAEFKAFATTSEFRDGTLKIIDAISDSHAAALVSDNRRLEGVTEQDQLWLRDTWMPLAVAAGIRRIAVVLARRGLGKIASEEIIGKFGKTPFVTRTFDSVADAFEWVQKQE
jgi:hypothetical protein